MNSDSGLRLALRLNAVFSTASALALFVFSKTIANVMAINAWILIVVAIGLAFFVVQLLITAKRNNTAKLYSEACLIAIADFMWVAATLFIIAGDWVSPAGELLMAGIAAPVLLLGGAQWYLARSRLAPSV